MHSLQRKLVNSGIKQESHPIFLHFFSGGVNKDEVVLRRGLGLVQMTKRHGIEFPDIISDEVSRRLVFECLK